MIKNILTLIIITTFSFGVFAGKEKKSTSKGHEITVKINNTQDTVCYLAYHLGDQKYVKDTTFINKKKEFVFKGDKPLPGGIYIVYFPNKANFEIIVNNQNFRIETDTGNFTNGFITEEEENKVFYDYLKFTSQLNDEATPIAKRRTEILTELKDDNLPKGKKEKFEDEKKDIENQLRGFKDKVDAYRNNLFETKPNLFVVKTFLAVEEVKIPEGMADSLKFPYYKSHFFDNIDFKDDRMMRTPLVNSKVERYLEKMTMQIPDSIIKEADYMIGKTNDNSELLKYLIITITNKYSKSKIMCMDKVYIHMVQKYYATGKAYWADSVQVEKLTDRARTLSWTACDVQTPNLMLRDTNDIFQQLYLVNAPYTIAYFWDPDCGHCKKVTPKLVKAYNEYLKEIGVKIYSVTTSKNKTKWLKFIKEKGMQDWINVYDPDHKSGFRQLYDITSTPKVYIMDKDKKIIARQLGVDQVADFIKQKIKMDNK